MEKRWGGIQFERYADDIVCHCASEREAQALKSVLGARFTACDLTLHQGEWTAEALGEVPIAYSTGFVTGDDLAG